MTLDELVKGKTAVITGASRGLGAMLATDYAGRGMQLGICARSAPALPSSDTVLAESLDVTDVAALTAFAAAVEARFGAIDLWINNAGVLDPIQPLRDVALADFQRHIDVNLTGVFVGSQLYLRHRRAVGGGGVLINISSGAARKPYSGWGAYCAGKAGVERMTECIAVEEASSGLRAYSVAPGVIDTEMQALIRSKTAADFPEIERFVELKEEDGFNTGPWVAKHLLAMAFDPAAVPEEVAASIPDEKP